MHLRISEEYQNTCNIKPLNATNLTDVWQLWDVSGQMELLRSYQKQRHDTCINNKRKTFNSISMLLKPRQPEDLNKSNAKNVSITINKC